MNEHIRQRLQDLQGELHDLRFAFIEDYFQMDQTDRDFMAGYIAGLQAAVDHMIDRAE